ncbi:hypothetical protein GOP47_0010305 [Adiantum capillus-veneris]|uniref:Ubiquitin-like domain-containing protein n=1 Tax=Adiantum capillus-veneris TaxID=13818 RepID=A0A9D4UUH7_ADICA|nr:hypothetical protein GOP47_0010305 [Adiantum capillus-veneris]
MGHLTSAAVLFILSNLFSPILHPSMHWLPLSAVVLDFLVTPIRSWVVFLFALVLRCLFFRGFGGIEDKGRVEMEIIHVGVKEEPTSINQESQCRVLQVATLRELISKETSLPIERLKLVYKGKTLLDKYKDDSTSVKLTDGDCIVGVVAPKAPPKHVQNRDGFEDDDELRFRAPESASRFQMWVIQFLQKRLKLPDLVLILLFSVSLRGWIMLLGWFSMAPVAYKWDLGPLYILATAFAVIFFNLGKRQEGDASAYSIFNEGFRELPGTLNAERLDRDIRAGQF